MIENIDVLNGGTEKWRERTQLKWPCSIEIQSHELNMIDKGSLGLLVFRTKIFDIVTTHNCFIGKVYNIHTYF